MNLKEIREIIELITEKGIAEFELERSGTRLKISRVAARGLEVAAASPPAATAVPVPTTGGVGPRSTLPEAASIAPPGAAAPISSEDIVTRPCRPDPLHHRGDEADE